MPSPASSRQLVWDYIKVYRKPMFLGLLTLLIVDGLEVLPPYYMKRAVDILVDHGPLSHLGAFAAAYLATMLVQGVCRYFWRMLLIRSSMLAGRDLRNRYSSHLYTMSATFYDKRRIGELMSLATNDVEAIRMALGPGLLVLADAAFYFLFVPIAMVMLSPKLTLLAFLPLPFIPWWVMRNEKKLMQRYEDVQESFSRVSGLVQEGLTGIRVVKAFARENAQVDRLRAQGREFVDLNLSLARVQSAFGPTLDFAMGLGLVALLWIGGASTIDGAVTIGTFVAFQRYVQKMVWPMAALGMGINFFQRAFASSGRLNEVFNVRPEVSTPSSPAQVAPVPRPTGWRTPGRVEFRNLTFRFPGTETPVLQGLHLTVEPGERIALVGAIGSGKTALLSLVPRLYPVEAGQIWIDGVDINHWPLAELREQVGFVAQDVFLFSESVSANVAYGLPAIDVDKIQNATRLASVHDDVEGLVGRYETRLGERGVNLSGGQKQRLSIARALAKSPSILVLDDALSSVDVRTEERILAGLRARSGRNTELIAAHRISTVKDATRILVLQAGRVVQEGRHSALLADRGGLYWKFHEQQRLKEDLEAYVSGL